VAHLVALTYVDTEPERLALVALLEAHEIPCHVQGLGFGGLFPGIQINHYNARRILIPDQALEEARELLAAFRAAPSRMPPEFDWLDTLRCLAEFFIGGWLLLMPRAHPGRPMDDETE
jgi:hypothetical protein